MDYEEERDWFVNDPLAAHDTALTRVLAAQLALDDGPSPLLARRASPARTARPGPAPNLF